MNNIDYKDNKDNKRIYIIGSVASGKTTLAKHLSKKLNIDYYSLDKVVWNDENNIKRNEKEIKKRFNKILKKDKWIIEDVGRNIFQDGKEFSDIIYYLEINKLTIYFRVIKRWFKQKINIEEYDYKPTIKSLKEMIKWAKKYNKKKDLEKYLDKVIFLSKKDINSLYKEE